MVNKSKEKESDRDSSDKKRRKSSSTAVGESSAIKMPREDVYAVSEESINITLKIEFEIQPKRKYCLFFH